MEQVFRVAIHYGNNYGYIEYDPVTHKIRVVLDNPAKRGEVEAYLGKPQVVRIAERSLRDFRESWMSPADSLPTLQVVLTRLWEHTGVFVDWSRPIPALD